MSSCVLDKMYHVMHSQAGLTIIIIVTHRINILSVAVCWEGYHSATRSTAIFYERASEGP